MDTPKTVGHVGGFYLGLHFSRALIILKFMTDILPITHSSTLDITRNQTTMSLVNSTNLPITFSNVLDLTGANPYV